MKKCPKCGSLLIDKHEKPKPIHTAPYNANEEKALMIGIVIVEVIGVMLGVIVLASLF